MEYGKETKFFSFNAMQKQIITRNALLPIVDAFPVFPSIINLIDLNCINMHASIADEEENTTELKFGDVDFSQVQCLTNDEMYLLLTKRQAHGFTNE